MLYSLAANVTHRGLEIRYMPYYRISIVCTQYGEQSGELQCNSAQKMSFSVC